MKQKINIPDQTIHADTMLAGLYEAGQHFASLLQANPGEKRTSFTAVDFVKDIDKGGADINWPKGEYKFTINTTKEGNYTVPGSRHLFTVIADVESMLRVTTAKRRAFAIQACQQQAPLATITFTMDKITSKLRDFCAKDPLRKVIENPAIDIEAGIMVASDGRVLVAHKLQDYHRTVPDQIVKRVELAKRIRYSQDDIARICISFPKEALAFKGTVICEVRPADTDCDLIVTVTDTNGKSAIVKQQISYPNWQAVMPSKQGLVFPIPAGFTNTLKSFTKSMPYPKDAQQTRICMNYQRYADKLLLLHNNPDYEISLKAEVPMYNEQGIFVCLSATLLLKELQLGFDQIEYYGYEYTLVLKSSDTRAIIMPMNPDGYETLYSNGCYYRCDGYNTSRHNQLPDNDFKDWLYADIPAASASVKPKRTRKSSAKPTAVPVLRPVLTAPAASTTKQPSVGIDYLRESIRQRLQALRSA